MGAQGALSEGEHTGTEDTGQQARTDHLCADSLAVIGQHRDLS